MTDKDIFTPRHLHHVVNDLCTGGDPEVLQRLISGYVLSKKEQEYLRFIYTGETTMPDLKNDFDQAIAEALPTYIESVDKNEKVEAEIEDLLARKADVWCKEYFNCGLADIPLVNTSYFQEQFRGTYLSVYAEFLYLTDALKVKKDAVYDAFAYGCEQMKSATAYVRKRNEEMAERVQKATSCLNNAERLDTIELSEVSTTFYGIEIGLFRILIIKHLLQIPLLPQSLTHDYLANLELQLSSLKKMLCNAERLHREAWCKFISPDQHFLLQPFAFYYHNGERVNPFFIMRLNYNMALMLIAYCSARINQAKLKLIENEARYYPSQHEDMNFIYYFVNPVEWSPQERLQSFLDMHFPVCYFHGSLQQLAPDFAQAPSDFHLVCADNVVAIYEWHTRLFIQLPRRISSEMEMSVIQHTIDQYQEALKKYKILNLHHD